MFVLLLKNARNCSWNVIPRPAPRTLPHWLAAVSGPQWDPAPGGGSQTSADLSCGSTMLYPFHTANSGDIHRHTMAIYGLTFFILRVSVFVWLWARFPTKYLPKNTVTRCHKSANSNLHCFSFEGHLNKECRLSNFSRQECSGPNECQNSLIADMQ